MMTTGRADAGGKPFENSRQAGVTKAEKAKADPSFTHDRAQERGIMSRSLGMTPSLVRSLNCEDAGLKPGTYKKKETRAAGRRRDEMPKKQKQIPRQHPIRRKIGACRGPRLVAAKTATVPCRRTPATAASE